MIKNKNLIFFKLLVSLFAGVAAAISAKIIFYALSLAAEIREQNDYFIWTIVIAALATKFFYDQLRLSQSEGHHLILENYKLTRPLPAVMGPIGVVSSFLAHLSGASVGREGSVVQLTAIFVEQFKKYFSRLNIERAFILQQAVSAGFSAALGAPLAGAWMSVELFRGQADSVEQRSRFIFCLLSAVSANLIGHFIGLDHAKFVQFAMFKFELSWIFWLVISGFIFALVSVFYIQLKIFFSKIHHLYLQSNWGLILLALFLSGFLSQKFFEPFRGLGVAEIQDSFLSIKPWYFSFFKMIFTIWSLQLLKLKGGEFTPLVFIGASFGSFLSSIVPLPTMMLTALGFVSVYGAVNQVPISMAILAAELFSVEVGVMALITAGLASYLFRGFCRRLPKTTI